MPFREDATDKQEKKEQDSTPKADIEIKHPWIAQQVDKEFSQYIENQEDRKESMEKLSKESKALHKTIMEGIEKQFEAQFSSGEMLSYLQQLKTDIDQNGSESVLRNRGVGYTMPLQLILRSENFNIDADGMKWPATIGALDDFCTYYNIERAHPKTMLLTSQEMDAIIAVYQSKHLEQSPTAPKEKTEKKLTPEQLHEKENKKYKEALFTYFIKQGHLKPRLEDILPGSKDAGRAGDRLSKKQKELHDMMRADDGVNSIAFGPFINRTSDSWLDLSSFDFEKNPNIVLTAHTNKWFEHSFTVNANDITRKKNNGDIAVNFVNLYKKTRQELIPAYFQSRFGGTTEGITIA